MDDNEALNENGQTLTEEQPETTAVDPGQIDETIIEFLTSLIERGEWEVEPEINADTEDSIAVLLKGPDAPQLVGREGQTLEALQYLTGIVANRGLATRRRISLDADNYRQTFEDKLVAKALEWAAQVKEHGQEAVLDPLSGRERFIIHNALTDHPDVYTYSEGEGDDRRLVISPKDKSQMSQAEP